MNKKLKIGNRLIDLNSEFNLVNLRNCFGDVHIFYKQQNVWSKEIKINY